MQKIRERLVSILEVCGWGLMGPAVISGMYFISNVLFSQDFAFRVALVVLMGTLFAVIVMTGSHYNNKNKTLAYAAGLLSWMFVAIFTTTLTSISVSRTTLLVAGIVYGAILVNRLLSPPPPSTYSE